MPYYVVDYLYEDESLQWQNGDTVVFAPNEEAARQCVELDTEYRPFRRNVKVYNIFETGWQDV